jgi:hypothetical protein
MPSRPTSATVASQVPSALFSHLGMNIFQVVSVARYRVYYGRVPRTRGGGASSEKTAVTANTQTAKAMLIPII